MRSFASLAVLVLVVVLVLFARGGCGPTSPERRVAADFAATEPATARELREPDARAGTSGREPAAPDPTAARAPAATTVPVCIVTGRVHDMDGAPLANALVQLAAHQVWAEGADAPVLDRFGPRGWLGQVGFETSTDESGVFRLEVPVPTTEPIRLYVKADRHHDSHYGLFGGTQSESMAPLIAGLRDLGELRLSASGAVHGRVVDSAGEPLAGVELDLAPTRFTTLGRSATTDADGRYVIEHAPLGTFGIRSKHAGHRVAFLEPVIVEAGRDSGPVDFVLTDAETIEGRVVNAEGLPVEGAHLWGLPESSGSGMSGKSGADGRFTLFLPQDDPYSLAVTHADYTKWGSEFDKTTLFRPGERDLLITLERATKIRFLVVDDATGAPIESFGFHVLVDNGSKAKRRVSTGYDRPREEPHPGGIVDSAARAGADVYLVFASGYLLARGEVEPEASGESDGLAQTIRLSPGARVLGRVVEGGAAVPGVSVEAVGERRYAARGAFQPNDDDRFRVLTDETGRFEFAGLSLARQRITLHPTTGAPVVLEERAFDPSTPTDLGDLELVQGGSLEGVVILPAGIDASGLSVYLTPGRAGLETVTDRAGRFRFEDVPVGTVELSQGGRPGSIDRGGALSVEIASGETAFVEFDLRPLVLVNVELTLDFDGHFAEGVRVDLVSTSRPKDHWLAPRGRFQASLGSTDAHGVVRGAVRAFGETRVVAWIPGIGQLDHDSARIDVQPGGGVVRAVHFHTAQLEFRLSDVGPLPVDGKLEIGLEATDGSGTMQVVTIPFVDGQPQLGSGAFLTLEGDVVRATGLRPGRCLTTVYSILSGAEIQRTDLGAGSYRSGPKREWERTGEVLLQVGQRAALLKGW